MSLFNRRRHQSRLLPVESGPATGSREAEHRHYIRVKLLQASLLAVLLLLAAPFLLITTSRPPAVPLHCTIVGQKLPSTAAHKYHGPPVELPDRFTLVINSYKRHALLQRAIAHFAKCRKLDVIRVVWCEEGLPPTRAESPRFYSEQKEVRYDIMATNSLNNRFSPVEGLRTEAVLSLDDDILIPCDVLADAFEVWKRDKRNMVGFYPRAHAQGQDCRYTYVQGPSALLQHGRFSMVLTKASFLHRDYLEMYTNHMQAGIRQYVDAHRNCEDLAMSFLVANVTGAPPTFYHSARAVDLGKGLFKVKGISSNASHTEARSDCLNSLVKLYDGVMPLKLRSVGGGTQGVLMRLSPVVDFVSAVLHGHI